MKNSFKVKVNSKWEFDIPNEDVHSLDVVKIKDKKYHLLKDHQSFQGEIVDANLNKRT